MTQRFLNVDSGLLSPMPEELFLPLRQEAAAAEKISRPALSYFEDAFLRLRRNKLAMMSLAVIGLVTAIGIVGPWFFPNVENGVPFENHQNANDIDQGPSWGQSLLAVDDYAPIPDDQIDAAYDASVPLKQPAELTAVANLKIVGNASVNGVFLSWDVVPGVSGYMVYRLLVPESGFDLQELAAGKVERGIGIGDISNPAQHSYNDGLGLDPSAAYAYSVVPFVVAPESGERSYSGQAAVLQTALINTMKLSDARLIDKDVTIGATLRGRAHLFGTDGLGRDVLARMIQGTRVDMLLALLVPTLCITIGLLFGAFSGLVGGKVDTLCMRIVEVVDNFPDLLIFIILQVAIGKGLLSLVIALSAFSWAGFARLVRGEVLRMRELEFVQASRLLGAPVGRLIARHIGPNLMGLIIIAWSARIPGVIASEAFLSLLGLGLEQPTPSWGNVVFDAARRLQVNPVQFFLPASVLGITLLCFYLLGDSMRDAFDPKLRGRT